MEGLDTPAIDAPQLGPATRDWGTAGNLGSICAIGRFGGILRLGTTGKETLRLRSSVEKYSGVGQCKRWGTAGILCGWALLGSFMVGHCRDHSAVGHCKDIVRLGTSGISPVGLRLPRLDNAQRRRDNSDWALLSYSAVGEPCKDVP